MIQPVPGGKTRPFVATSRIGTTMADRRIQICHSVICELESLTMASVSAMAKTVAMMVKTPWGRPNRMLSVGWIATP